MPLTAAEMDRKIDEHFAFEANDDVEGVLSTLTPDVEHDVVGWPTGPAHGREAARPFYETLFADLAEGEVKSLRRYHGANFLVDESLWRGTAPGRPFGIEGRGRPLEFRLLHVIEFTEGGDILRENVWVDLAAVIRQLPQVEDAAA
ncbi:nuclear transport factor 2 family protein [Parvibaculum sp.]|uniref:nuclear transport factor 2 family protein n=1 Tax=Parvibaculum sp. TaxID=2024848 RepID=UPI00391C9E58